MKKPLIIALFAIGGLSVVTGQPCWSSWPGNTCGSAPSCTGMTIPTEGWSTSMPCGHVYCDNANTCQSNSSRKRMLQTMRTMYIWTCSNGTAKSCVTNGTTTSTGGCCLCSQPGTIYD